MKLIKNTYFSFFPYFSGKDWLFRLLLLLLVGFSYDSFAQIHVSENTVFSVKENTILYVADEASEITLAKVEKQTKPKSSKESAKKQNKPSPPPITKKDSETESRKTVLSFTSGGKAPASSFYPGKTTKVAIVHSGNFVVKSFPPKKAYENTIYTFLLNAGDQKISISFCRYFTCIAIHLEEQITRPPPFGMRSHSEIS